MINCKLNNNGYKRWNVAITLGLSLLLLSSCAGVLSPQQRHTTAVQLASSHQWRARQITTSQFDLVSYHAQQYAKQKLLTVYIEGDGLAWRTRTIISNDPTPINPVGLRLALKHPQGNVVYLARPCQYTGGINARNCNKHDWTNGRFSEEVIASTNEALNTLKTEFEAKQLQLIGYSGGAAVAALLAARRDDVVTLITVAGNLDHRAWTAHHHLSPLSNSLNPADYREQLTDIEQIHFVGANDRVIPPFLAEQFVAGEFPQHKAKLIIISDMDHYCCWGERWKVLFMPLVD